MDPSRAALAVGVAVLLVGVLAGGILAQDRPLAPRPEPEDGPGEPGPSGVAPEDHELASFDGTRIVFTVRRPDGASADRPVPLILLGHGVVVNRTTPILVRLADALVAAGFGVLAPDWRGHGESGGTSRLSDPGRDVRDASALLDWAHDHLDWVQRQPGTNRSKDLVAGGWGFSLGGAMIHLSAALDGRLDAIVPQNTMNDYATIIAPNGAVKSFWMTAFMAFGFAPEGSASGTWRPDPVFQTLYAETMATNALPEEGRRLLATLSPYTYLHRITQPALYVQGMTDMAFPVDEAWKSAATLRGQNGTAHVFTWLGGHKTPQQVYTEGAPCGDYVPVIVDWFDRTLRGADRPLPPLHSIAMTDGSCLRLDSIPDTGRTTPLPPLALPANAGSLLVPLFTAGDAMRVVGDPVFAGNANVAGVDDILYASLVVRAPNGVLRVVDDQVTSLRLAGPTTTSFRLAMNGVGLSLQRGDDVFLKLDRVNEWFATNSGRTPGAIAITDASLSLPLVP